MDKTSKIIFILLILFALAGVGAGIYFLFQNPGSKSSTTQRESTADVVTIPDNPERGDPGYVETDTKIESTSKSRFSGTFAGITNEGEFNLSAGADNIFTYQLNETEIAIQCTNQPLENVDSVDAGQVSQVKISDPESLKTNLTIGEPVFVIASEEGEIFKVHTVYISDEACESFE